jgi:integrase
VAAIGVRGIYDAGRLRELAKRSQGAKVTHYPRLAGARAHAMPMKRHGMAFLAPPIGTSAAVRFYAPTLRISAVYAITSAPSRQAMRHVAKRPRSCKMEIMIACRLRVGEVRGKLTKARAGICVCH